MAFTIVSAIVRDSDGQNWVRGSWKLEFIPNPANPNLSQYQVDGTSPLMPSVISQNGPLDINGYFSVNLYDNTTITPIGSSWKLTICPLSSAQCGFYVFAAAGASLDISGALTFLLPPPRFLGVYPNYGYNDGEVIISNKPGSTYYNVVQQVQKYYNDQTQTWAIVGTGPAGPPGTPGIPPTVLTAAVDVNTLTTTGVYFLVGGISANGPAPATGGFNSAGGVLEVYSYINSSSPSTSYIFQRFQSSTDSAPGNSPGRFFFRWQWFNVSTVWTSWFYFLPDGTA